MVRALVIVVLLLLAACAREPAPEAAPAVAGAPTASAATPAADAEPAAATPEAEPAPAPAPAVEPMPAAAPQGIAIGEPNPSAPGVVDASCRTDADCAIKDVGSCCGAHPACVNTASPTFPERVKADCAKSGRMSTCGFPAITGCTCNAGRCEGTGAGAPAVQ